MTCQSTKTVLKQGYVAGILIVFALTMVACGGQSPIRVVDYPKKDAAQDLVNESALATKVMRNSPKFKSIDFFLKRCKGVLIFPDLVKAGLIFGGEGGSGVLVAHKPDGSWSPPAFYTLGGGSFGLQIGVQETALILLFMSDRAFQAAIDSGLTLGADTSVAAGSEGAESEVSTATAQKDVYYFANVGGLFAGASLEGSVINIRQSFNDAYYSSGANPRKILIEQRFDQPGTQVLKDALRY